MADAIMHQEDMFVVLVPGKAEVFLTPDEMLEQLQHTMDQHPEAVPRDVQKLSTPDAQALHLRDSHCEYAIGPGEYMQWYVVRLEK